MATFDRRPLRDRRAALAQSVRRDAAAAVAKHARGLEALSSAASIGAYVPVRGEVDPWPLLATVRRRGAIVHVPVMPAGPPPAPGAAAPVLDFAVLQEGASLSPGRFGIPEPPASAPRRAPELLDVVLVPLVAFDASGTRVGMGAGWYDRTFAFRAASPPPPLLVGLAYHWQEVAALDADPWDVRLDAVITDRGVQRFR